MAAVYEEGLVAAIADGARTVVEDGLAIEVRPVPDDAREHALDPRIASFWGRRGKDRDLPVSLPLDGVDVDERTVVLGLDGREIEVRVVRPKGVEEALPVVFWLHGGSFCAGSWNMFRDTLPALSCRARAAVVFPEYRLAPEHPFPAAVDDCRATVEWALAHADELGIDPGRVCVAGDSAGGSLADALALEMGEELDLLGLFYPLTDAGEAPEDWSMDLFPRLEEHGEAIGRNIRRFKRYAALIPEIYTEGDADRAKDPLVSALHAEDVSGFPRTLVVTCEFDYLRHQGEAFARRLDAAGVGVRCVRYGGTGHAFFENCGLFPQVEDAIGILAAEIARL